MQINQNKQKSQLKQHNEFEISSSSNHIIEQTQKNIWQNRAFRHAKF